ncbi:hypothetical protein L207DRAFT_632133 [Hyaloscypha variabilis F]|uniref:Uncharacterized protein n=1 Tax=Hyaloscypha variabilis (strain UAMH 11265 / GT02V1 / F) TaxID=1149755 RepID=A0A2J6RV04_HYAVF|nr:hypothetical protein L207DRAFT_632133 [Hyaloscypha variabilis F]
MEILTNNLPPPEATHLTTLIINLLLRWLIDVAIFLLIFLGFMIWRSAHMDEDAQREEVWRVLKGEIELGSRSGGAAEKEERRWFVERLGGFVQRCEQGGAEVEVEGRMDSTEDEDWMGFRRAGREMAMIAEEMKRARKGKEEIPQGGWCDCDPTSSLLIPKA